ncbi:MAG: succinate dehydrogenase iron-sulfur subunit [Deltaproteobacteria bacterium]|nr:succinate dehydrogenase iron-sulfur subunit [Deltaproteobacteria bacterium]MBW2152078.1 succinate dehydrogenase iron-sulfur subunit [Deltaproteobacteria bacterium]
MISKEEQILNKDPGNKKIVKVFRYDPTGTAEGHFDRFEVNIHDQNLTTILDLLLKIQKEQDPSLSFRYACRVSMCGSCAMVINGRERLACKTVVGSLKDKEITIRPLNHFPVIKDLVVDMEPFFKKYKDAIPFFEPAKQDLEPARIPPHSKERQDIGLSTECIACGCCVSSCTMVHSHESYCGPAALNRAFTLLADSRDALKEKRMACVLDGCYLCRTEFNCTELCPKQISPTRAIKYIQRKALSDILGHSRKKSSPIETEAKEQKALEMVQEPLRRRFLKHVLYTLGTGTAFALAGVLAVAGISPATRKSKTQWIRVGNVNEFKQAKVSTVNVRYRVKEGFYETMKTTSVLVVHRPNENRMTVYNSRCTHLGCTVRWDEGKQLFLCACHGGAFNLDGSVKAGPPSRPLDRYAFKVKNDSLFVEVV